MASAILLAALMTASDLRVGLEACSKIKGTKERLACFDALAKEASTPPQSASTGGRSWKLETNVSAVDDTKTLALALDADAPVQTKLGPVTPTLIFRCRGAVTEVLVSTGSVEAGDQTRVRLRLDSAPPEAEGWSPSKSRDALFFYGNKRRQLELIHRMKSSQKLVFEWTPWISNPLVATFSLAGLAEASAPLSEACGWEMKQIPPIGLKYVTITKEIAVPLNIPYETGGAFATEVEPGSLADKAGIQKNDVVVGVNGTDVSRAEQLTEQLAKVALPPLELVTWRGTTTRPLTINF
jgi:type VI secretion system protein VasI